MAAPYSKELADLICDRLAHGESLTAICRTLDGVDGALVTRWLLRSEKNEPGFEGFADLYRFARDVGVDVLFDELWDIANDDSNDVSITDRGEWAINSAKLQRDRLRVDTLKWRLSKLAPKKYGERVALEHEGANGQPLAPVLNVLIGKQAATAALPAPE